MSRTFILISALLFSITAGAVDRAPKFHVVIDLDWTLIYNVTDNVPVGEKDLIKFGNQTYRPTDHLAKVIEKLIAFPDVEVSIYSGGDAIRNRTVLKKIKLSDGRSLHDVIHRVLSFKSLKEMHPEDGVKRSFTDKYKKDLSKITPDLDNVVILEDVAKFLVPGQEKNTLFLGETYAYFPSWEAVEKYRTENPGARYLPESKAAFWRERNKLVRALDIILEAREATLKNKEKFAEGVHKRLSDPFEQHIASGFFRMKQTFPIVSLKRCLELLGKIP